MSSTSYLARVRILRVHTISALRIVSLCGMIAVAACSKDESTNAVPSTPASLSLASGAQQSAVVGSALGTPVAFKVVDQNGAPMEGVDVTLVLTGGGSVSANVVTTDANGLASVTWTLGTTAGADTLSASVAALPGVVVAATALPDAPASLAVVSGASQSGTVGSTLGTPLEVRALDQYGNPVPNVVVNWADDANGTFESPTSVTDTNGIAINVYTLGPSAGPEDVSATVATPAAVVTTSLVELGS